MSTSRDGGGRLTGWACAALYVLLCAVPLGLAFVGPLPPGRSFAVEFGVALGFIGIGMMGAQFVLTARFSNLSRTVGQDLLLRFHRTAGILAAIFVLAHAVILFVVDPEFRAFLDPRVNAPRAGALSAVIVVIVLLSSTSLLRARLAIQYEWWRLAHAVMAAFIMMVGAAHIFMVGHYAQPLIKAIAFILIAAAPVALLGEIRVLRPLRQASRRAWRVADVRREGAKVWTLELRPESGDGLGFEPGQFIWLGFGAGPLTLQQHPFTIASSALRPKALCITIKELGDFTRSIAAIERGSRVFIEGPAGGLVVPASMPRILMIAGGIGITPMMSVLRTMADADDPRPVTLIYANASIEKAVFAEELEAISRILDLRVVHVPETPPAAWTGPTGFVDAAVISDALPEAHRQSTFVVICGPDAMMVACERVLLDMGLPRRHIRSEHFNVV